MLSALCHREEGAAGPKPCPEGLRLGGEGGGIQRLLQIHGPGTGPRASLAPAPVQLHLGWMQARRS